MLGSNSNSGITCSCNISTYPACEPLSFGVLHALLLPAFLPQILPQQSAACLLLRGCDRARRSPEAEVSRPLAALERVHYGNIERGVGANVAEYVYGLHLCDFPLFIPKAPTTPRRGMTNCVTRGTDGFSMDRRPIIQCVCVCVAVSDTTPRTHQGEGVRGWVFVVCVCMCVWRMEVNE